MTSRKVIHARIDAERERQDQKFPQQLDASGAWAISPMAKLAVLAEEFGEAARAVCDGTANNLRDELVQIAAVCVRWLEAFSDDPGEDAEKARVRDPARFKQVHSPDQPTPCPDCGALSHGFACPALIPKN